MGRRINRLAGFECAVVMYHYVRESLHAAGETPGEGVRGLTPQSFAEQVDALARTHEPIDWSTLFLAMAGRGSLPRRCCLLTFDDGLRDHLEFVAPILEQRDIRGTFFVPTGVLRVPRLLPAHGVHLLLDAIGEGQLGRELRRELFDQGLQAAWHAAFDAVERRFNAPDDRPYGYEPNKLARTKYLINMILPADVRDRALERLVERHVGPASFWARRWYLSARDVVELQSNGHTIGGHGHSHEPLARLAVDEQRHDIARTAETLNELLGPAPRPYSYPFGSCTDDSAALLARAGFAHAFTTKSELLTRRHEAHALPRVDTIHVSALLGETLACP